MMGGFECGSGKLGGCKGKEVGSKWCHNGDLIIEHKHKHDKNRSDGCDCIGIYVLTIGFDISEKRGHGVRIEEI